MDATNGSDILMGTTSDDSINALSGDDFVDGQEGHDTILGGLGDDTILGGVGDDIIYGFAPLRPTIDSIAPLLSDNDVLYGGLGNDTIYGNGGDDVIYGNAPLRSKIDIIGIPFSDNDVLYGGAGNDTMFGSVGQDVLDGGLGADIANYSLLPQAITLKGQGIIDKGISGIDKIVDIETIVGAKGKSNLIDATSTPTSFRPSPISIKVSLLKEELSFINLPGGNRSFEVIDFVDVIGTPNDDVIAGGHQPNVLVGGAGNDQIIAVSSHVSRLDGDTLIGVDPSAMNPGSNGEVDTLVGGDGAETFVLGDTDHVYYLGDSFFGYAERAVIEKFESGKDTIQLKGEIDDYLFFGNVIVHDRDPLTADRSGLDVIAQVSEGFTVNDLVFV